MGELYDFGKMVVLGWVRKKYPYLLCTWLTAAWRTIFEQFGKLELSLLITVWIRSGHIEAIKQPGLRFFFASSSFLDSNLRCEFFKYFAAGDGQDDLGHFPVLFNPDLKGLIGQACFAANVRHFYRQRISRSRYVSLF